MRIQILALQQISCMTLLSNPIFVKSPVNYSLRLSKERKGAYQFRVLTSFAAFGVLLQYIQAKTFIVFQQ